VVVNAGKSFEKGRSRETRQRGTRKKWLDAAECHQGGGKYNIRGWRTNTGFMGGIMREERASS